MDTTGLTKVQLRILTLLRDGLPHTMEEVRCCLYDDMGPMSNIHAHLTAIRKKLQPQQLDINPKFIKRKMHYRLVRVYVPESALKD